MTLKVEKPQPFITLISEREATIPEEWIFLELNSVCIEPPADSEDTESCYFRAFCDNDGVLTFDIKFAANGDMNNLIPDLPQLGILVEATLNWFKYKGTAVSAARVEYSGQESAPNFSRASYAQFETSVKPVDNMQRKLEVLRNTPLALALSDSGLRPIKTVLEWDVAGRKVACFFRNPNSGSGCDIKKKI